jgi:opacity protein-like surface antigen
MNALLRGPIVCRSLLTLLLTVGAALEAGAEWYAGGYGGVSLNGKITDGDMPIYAKNVAQTMFPNPHPLPGDYLSQTFRILSDINLKNSPMFGGRVGYFFTNYGFKWAGLELEAFTTQPTIKQQTIQTQQTILSNRQNDLLDPQPQSVVINTALPIGEARLRVTTVALNAVIRYPGKIFQPYAGVGVGLFYFQGASPFPGSDVQPGLNTFAGLKVFVTEKIALFGEYKYNRATIHQLDDVYGLKGNYSISHIAGGIAYHF